MSARLAGLLAGLVFLLIGSGQIYLSLRLPGGLGISAAEPGPGLFPALVGTLMCLAALAHLVQTWIAERETRSAQKAPVDIVLLTATLAAYILLLPRAGFVVSAFTLLLGTLSIFGLPGWWRRLLIAAAATAVSYFVFTWGLGVSFPQPSWFN